jgi:hypothetical protein
VAGTQTHGLSHNGAGTGIHVHLFAVYDHDAADPIVGAGAVLSGSASVNQDSPSVTAAADCLLIGGFQDSYAGSAGTKTGPASMTYGNGPVAESSLLGSGYETIASGATTGTRRATSTVSRRSATAAVTIRSGAAPPPEAVTGAGALTAAAPTLSGAGTVTAPTVTGAGALSAAAPVLSGAGTLTLTGAGDLTAAAPVLSGAGTLTLTGAGDLTAAAPTLTGAGAVTVTGAGDLVAAAVELAGAGLLRLSGAGDLLAPVAVLSGAGQATGGLVRDIELRIAPGGRSRTFTAAGASRRIAAGPGRSAAFTTSPRE